MIFNHLFVCLQEDVYICINDFETYKFTMVNSKEFAKRLEKVMQYYELSAAGFADKINVGRSSISHILSGRNKPSLDFVLKIVEQFQEVELYWLLNGKGIFPKSNTETSTPSSIEVENNSTQKPIQPSIEKSNSSATKNFSEAIQPTSSKKKIQKIVIFYEDGSFDAFEN